MHSASTIFPHFTLLTYLSSQLGSSRTSVALIVLVTSLASLDMICILYTHPKNMEVNEVASRWQSTGIDNNQWQSMAIDSNRWHSMTINGNPWQSMTIKKQKIFVHWLVIDFRYQLLLIAIDCYRLSVSSTDQARIFTGEMVENCANLCKFEFQGSKLTTNWSHMQLDFWLCVWKIMCGRTTTPKKPKYSATSLVLTQLTILTSSNC